MADPPTFSGCYCWPVPKCGQAEKQTADGLRPLFIIIIIVLVFFTIIGVVFWTGEWRSSVFAHLHQFQ